jgi:hypothetical protein
MPLTYKRQVLRACVCVRPLYNLSEEVCLQIQFADRQLLVVIWAMARPPIKLARLF